MLDPGPALRVEMNQRPWLRPLLMAFTVSAGLLLLCCCALAETWLLADVAALSLLGVGLLVMRRLPLGKECTVALSWVLACHALPQGHDMMTAVQQQPASMAWQFGFFVIGTALCDIKDAERDRAAGLRNLAALLSRGQLRLLCALAALAFGVPALWQGAWSMLVVSCALLLCAAWSGLLRHSYWSAIAVDAALCLVIVQHHQ